MITAKKTPPRNPTVADSPGKGPRVLSALAGLAAVVLSIASASGCAGDKAPNDTDADQGERVGSAAQALQQKCVFVEGDQTIDAYTNGAKPFDTYGERAYMVVGYGRNAMLRFKMPSIPEGAHLNTAQLQMKMGEVLPNHGAYASPIRIQTVKSPWTEHTVTFKNSGYVISDPTDPQVLGVVEGQIATADMMSFVTSWLDGNPNQGVFLYTDNMNTGAAAQIISREYGPATQPRLQICYTPNGCQSNPCKNGGTCTDPGNGTYTCACPANTTGTNCENLINPCASNPCQHNGTCTPAGNGFTCNCNGNDYFGNKCQYPNVCTLWGNVCNGGTCSPNYNAGPNDPIYSCACPPGLTGPRCNVAACPCNPADIYWKPVLTNVSGLEAAPTKLGNVFSQCGGGLPITGQDSRAYFPYWLFPTMNSAGSYMSYFDRFYTLSPNFCRSANPYAQTVANLQNPGVLWVLDEPNLGLELCAHPWTGVTAAGTAQDMAYCRAQFAKAPHIVPQTLPDLPLSIGLGAPTLLALAEMLRRRFGKKVAK